MAALSGRKPRIAVLSSYFPTRENPARGHSAYQTLRRLTHRYDFTAVCPLGIYPFAFRPSSYSYQGPTDKSYSPHDIQARYVEYPILPVLSRPWNGLVCAAYVRRAVHAVQPDLILNYWLYPDGYAAVRMGHELRVPVIVGAIGSDLRRIEDRLTRWWTGKTLRQASFLLTVSEDLRRHALLMGASAENSRTVLNGCDTSIFHPHDRLRQRARFGMEPDAEIVVYAGSLIPSKGVPDLMEAFTELAPERPRLRLVLVGEGPLRPEIERAAGHSARIRLAGLCDPGDVAAWLGASDVFCLPSHSEGCPNVVIEAIASGRPVVGTEIGGIPELVNHQCGVLVPAKNPPRLAAGLREALDRNWDADAISRQFSRSWEQVAVETGQLIDRLLAA